jgi:hypothetical protein
MVSELNMADANEDNPKSAQRQPPRSRFVPEIQQGMRVEERDQQLLCDLFLHGLMLRGQIERLYFSSTARCNARLRLLFDHKFVARAFPPYAPFGAQAIYSVGKAALPIVARRLEMDLPDVTRTYRRTKTPTFIEHTLASVDVYLAFRDAVRGRQDVFIERYLAELQCRHEWDIRMPGGAWRKEVFKPDGFVRLETLEGYCDYFLEVDLGHTSSRQFLGKLLTHERYLESGLFEQTYGVPTFRTLVVTTGARRLRNLRALVEEQNSRLFWLTTLEKCATDILGPVWDVPLVRESVPLITPF